MKYFNKSELKHSRIFFDQNPPRFGNWLISLIGLSLVISLIASATMIKPYIVTGQGIVTTTDNQYISTSVNGIVTEIFVNEGEIANLGEPLLKIANVQENLQITALNNQLQSSNEKLQIMEKYEKSLANKTNYMNNVGIEQEYYGYMEYYLSQVSKEDYSYNNLIKNLSERTNTLKSKESELQTLNNRINQIVIPDVSETLINETQNLLTNKKEELKELNDLLKITTDLDEIETLNNSIIDLSNEIRSYQDKLSNLNSLNEEKNKRTNEKNELLSKANEIETLVENIKDEIKQIKEQLDDPTSQIGQMYAQLLMELGKTKTTLLSQIDEIQSNLSIHIGQANTYTISALNTGIVHYLSNIKLGTTLQQNQVIGEISTHMNENLIVETYINAFDISKVSIGNQVNVAIVGVNTTKYGTLSGTLVSIDSGTITQETSNGTLVLYLARVNLNELQLISSSNTISLIKSMPVETRIIYEDETYLDWLLALLNFK